MRVLALAVLVFGAFASEEADSEEASSECPDLADGCTACEDVMLRCNGGFGDEDADFEPEEDDVEACDAATAAVVAAATAAAEAAAAAAVVWACTPATGGGADLDTQETCEGWWATPAVNGAWTAAVVGSCNAAADTCGNGAEACTADNCAAVTTCDDAATDDAVETDSACVWSVGNDASCNPATGDAGAALDTLADCEAFEVSAAAGQGAWAAVVAVEEAEEAEAEEAGDRRRLACDDDCLAEFVGDCDEAAALECMAQWTEFGDDCEDEWAVALADSSESPAAVAAIGAAVLLMFL